MPSVPLRALISPKSGGFAALTALLETAGANLSIVDPSGNVLLGGPCSEDSDRATPAPRSGQRMRHLALLPARPHPPTHWPSS